MKTNDDVRAAVRAYLALLDSAEPNGDALDAALARSLDELALAEHVTSFAFDDAEHPEPPRRDYQAARQAVGKRFPDYGYYNAPEAVLDRVGEAACIVGDAIDDLVDIASELRDVAWRWEHTSEADAIWHFENGFDMHWGEHLRGLQRYLLARRFHDANAPQTTTVSTVMLNLSGFLRASKDEAARRLLGRLGKALELDLGGVTYERYWKDDALYRFHGTLELHETSYRDAYFDIPARFAGVARGKLSLSCPHAHEAGHWDFSGGCAETSLSGVVDLSFNVVRKPVAGGT